VSTIYNGAGSLVSPTKGSNVQIVITSTTNAAPVSVLTNVPHGYNTGDTVEIEGTSVSALNAVWQITVVDTTHYTLNGSTAPGSTGSGGFSTDYELLPAFTIPANGDLADMGVLGATLEGLANPFPFLYRAAGQFRLYGIAGGNALIASDDQTLASGTSWVALTGVSHSLAALIQYRRPISATDWLELTATLSLSSDTSPPNGGLAGIGMGAPGSGATAFVGGASAPTKIVGVNFGTTITLSCMIQPGSAFAGGADFGIMALENNINTPSFFWNNWWNMSLKHWKAN
jgi:hypothetical protein